MVFPCTMRSMHTKCLLKLKHPMCAHCRQTCSCRLADLIGALSPHLSLSSSHAISDLSITFHTLILPVFADLRLQARGRTCQCTKPTSDYIVCNIYTTPGLSICLVSSRTFAFCISPCQAGHPVSIHLRPLCLHISPEFRCCCPLNMDIVAEDVALWEPSSMEAKLAQHVILGVSKGMWPGNLKSTPVCKSRLLNC